MDTSNEIITTARNFLKGKIESLKKDSYQCLFKEHPAPFPAILYCFSVIDLMGALYEGNAKSDAPVTKQANEYMTGVMIYPQNVSDLLQKVFRHKLVHLAQPNPVTIYGKNKYLWDFCHESRRNIHLKI